MKRTIKRNGITYNLQQTDKYKSVRIHLSFGNQLQEDTVSARAILPYLLRSVSQQYPTRDKLSNHLEQMYAAQLGVGSFKLGETHFTSFDLSIINNKFTINQEDLLEKGFALLHEILFHPLFKEDIFLDEKRLVEEYFLSNYSNKLRYTLQELIKRMFQGELYRIQALGMEEDFKTMTLDDVRKAYDDMLQQDCINITIVGDIDLDQAEEYITTYLYFEERHRPLHLLEEPNMHLVQNKHEEIIQDVNQAKLVQGYRFNVRYLDDDYYSALAFSTLLGGSSDSILHNKIREDLGLCYFISSSYDIYKGVVLIYSGIDYHQYPQVKDAIDVELSNIQQGIINEDDLTIAKKSIVNSFIESYDSNYSMAIRLERHNLFQKEITLEESIEKILSITKEDVERVSKKLVFDQSLILRGENHETV